MSWQRGKILVSPDTKIYPQVRYVFLFRFCDFFWSIWVSVAKRSRPNIMNWKRIKRIKTEHACFHPLFLNLPLHLQSRQAHSGGHTQSKPVSVSTQVPPWKQGLMLQGLRSEKYEKTFLYWKCFSQYKDSFAYSAKIFMTILIKSWSCQ